MTRAANASPGSLGEMAPRINDHPIFKGRSAEELERRLLEVRNFARSSIRPRALELDQVMFDDPYKFPWELVAEGSKLGLLNLIMPRASGGGTDQFCLSTSLISEELAAGCGGMATLFGAHSLGASPIVMGGPAFWDGVLKDAVATAGDARPTIMAFAITEPTAGTDVEHHIFMRSAKLVCHAEKVRGGYKLYGTKHFISNGSVATWLTVFMPLDQKRPYETLTCFLVDARDPGFSVTNVEHKMGHRASPAAEISFDGLFVPADRLIGREGDGMALTIGVLAGSRPGVGAIATGIARGAYERVLDWLQNDPAAAGLLERQQVQLALAEMHEAIHLSRQAYIDAATDFDTISLGSVMSMPALRAFAAMPSIMRTNPLTRWQMNSNRSRGMVMQIMDRKVGNERLTRTLALSSLAKARGSDTAMKVSGMALEIAGLECGALRPELEKCMRDAKLTQIYEGTNQLNRLECYDGLVANESMALLPSPAVADNNNGQSHVAAGVG